MPLQHSGRVPSSIYFHPVSQLVIRLGGFTVRLGVQMTGLPIGYIKEVDPQSDYKVLGLYSERFFVAFKVFLLRFGGFLFSLTLLNGG